MIEITIDKYEITFAPNTEAEEIIQNVRQILSTMYFEVINNREFGLNATYVDAPIQQSNMLSRVDIINKIRRDEPRAKVENIEYYGDAETGYTKPIVRISING